jgi:hypothetical protein
MKATIEFHDPEYMPFNSRGQRAAIENDWHCSQTGAVSNLSGIPLLEKCEPILGKVANEEEDVQEEDEDCHQRLPQSECRSISKSFIASS